MGLRQRGKHIVKACFVRSRVTTVAARIAPPAAVVLMYHSIVEDPRATSRTIGISQSRQAFERHIHTLARRFNPVSIEQVVRFVGGTQTLPRRAVAVTFDDGFADNFEVAAPILNRYGVPATFYILVGAVDTGVPPWYCRIRFAFHSTSKPQWNDLEGKAHRILTSQERESVLQTAWDTGARKTGKAQEEFVSQIERSLDVRPLDPGDGVMMTWDMARALRRDGHIIGAHTRSHPNLAYVSENEALLEIAGSKQSIEEALYEPIEHFSYPHPALGPEWNGKTLEITRQTGFKSAVLTRTGRVLQGDDPFTLNRIPAASDLDQWLWNLERTLLGLHI